MDFLRTPDQLAPARWSPTHDRAAIKTSFQSLFSPAATPNVGPTHTLLAPSPAHGLTPFLAASAATPGLVPPASALLAHFPHYPSQSPAPQDPFAHGTPYLTAVAREAVRREFMSIPTHVAAAAAAAAGHHTALSSHSHSPDSHSSNKYSIQVVANTGSPPAITSQGDSYNGSQNGSHNDSASNNAPSTTSPTDATVPTTVASNENTSQHLSSPAASSASAASAGMVANPNCVSAEKAAPLSNQFPLPPPQQHPHLQHPITSKNAPHAQPQPPVHPYFFPHPQHPQNMFMFPHGPMMMAPPPHGPIFAPPGMIMYPGAQSMQPHMFMHPAQPSLAPQPPIPAKSETPEQRKARCETEKQDLIREFKKKTREAALVRFRQKRRERRFGKLIRYDCRKKLADARPRFKGRFVRLKTEDDDSEGAQVVPNMQ